MLPEISCIPNQQKIVDFPDQKYPRNTNGNMSPLGQTLKNKHANMEKLLDDIVKARALAESASKKPVVAQAWKIVYNKCCALLAQLDRATAF
jgi:hypothetical protein